MSTIARLPTAELIDREKPALRIDGRGSFCFGAESVKWLKRCCAEGFHEPTLSILLLTFLRRSPKLFYDIGSLYGYFPLLVAAGVGQVPVRAFEMNPESHAALSKNLRLNASRGLDVSRIKAVHAAVGDKDSGIQRTSYKGFMLQPKSEGAREADILVTSIDAYAKKAIGPPGVIKIDVEGWEGFVLDGGVETFGRHAPVILMELHSRRLLAPHGRTRGGIVSMLLKFGYQAFAFGNHRAHTQVQAPIVAHPLSRNGVAKLPIDFEDRGDELVLFAINDPEMLWPGVVKVAVP